MRVLAGRSARGQAGRGGSVDRAASRLLGGRVLSQAGRALGALACLGLVDGGRAALVGSGGKTSLLFALVRAAAGRMPLAVAPTTKMWTPAVPGEVDEVVLLAGATEPPSSAPSGPARQAFGRAVEGGKLVGLEPSAVDLLWRRTPGALLLVEADGSRGLPLKVPAAHEPVVPTTASVVVWVAGLFALGRRAGEAVHRLASLSLGLSSSSPIDETSFCRILLEGGYPPRLPRGVPVHLVLTGVTHELEPVARRVAARVLKEALPGLVSWGVAPGGWDQTWQRL